MVEGFGRSIGNAIGGLIVLAVFFLLLAVGGVGGCIYFMLREPPPKEPPKRVTSGLVKFEQGNEVWSNIMFPRFYSEYDYYPHADRHPLAGTMDDPNSPYGPLKDNK